MEIECWTQWPGMGVLSPCRWQHTESRFSLSYACMHDILARMMWRRPTPTLTCYNASVGMRRSILATGFHSADTFYQNVPIVEHNWFRLKLPDSEVNFSTSWTNVGSHGQANMLFVWRTIALAIQIHSLFWCVEASEWQKYGMLLNSQHNINHM
jgi:hypothetical protein